MQNQITISLANAEHRDVIRALLHSERLPIDDLPVDLSHFFVATDNGFIIGAIGLEIYTNCGLLRSLIVKPEYRKMKIADGLIDQVENLGRQLALKEIYLLTETAELYFSKKGYGVSDRSNAPSSIMQSSEFSHVCPASAVLMKKEL